jgi:outer membrane protein assembly factor BamA
VGKGFLKTKVDITQEVDSSAANNVILSINVNVSKRTKIKDINIYGKQAP